jgi:hypothetical protein
VNRRERESHATEMQGAEGLGDKKEWLTTAARFALESCAIVSSLERERLSLVFILRITRVAIATVRTKHRTCRDDANKAAATRTNNSTHKTYRKTRRHKTYTVRSQCTCTRCTRRVYV